ncbi:MAG: 50S ribosomal protein L17 [Chloroflexi bacterium]|nr:50S ribosomal protein L17 [Chloroflexota bacterium]
MRHGVGGRHFNRPTGHRLMMYRTLVTDLLRHGHIKTTEPKAKEIRSMAEQMITLGKRGDLHARRQALAFITDETVVHKVFAEIAPRFAARQGGYTRIIKLGPRLGDAAPMAQIELLS